jgi:hypothetical protein
VGGWLRGPVLGVVGGDKDINKWTQALERNDGYK